LPRFMAGGTQNPLGARALYLGRTLYRIHGTNQPSTIGQFVSSGCIRLVNDDVEDLYGRVHVGTAVVVLDKNGQVSAPAQSAPAAPRKARNAARKPAPRVQAHSAPPAATPVVTSAAIAPPANAGKDIVAPVDAAKDGAGARANPAPEKTADNQ
ncbi:MAG: L,D-transpeptidase family protein, partial [Proteobacteria bacterium]|nr:L,D-transpeptidase family protein [Pseudomonadota bacterium]